MKNYDGNTRKLGAIGLMIWTAGAVYAITKNISDGQPEEVINYVLGLVAGLFMAYMWRMATTRIAFTTTTRVKTEMKLTRNAAQCRDCGDIVESKTVHDFKVCSCWSWDKGGKTGIMVDGGLEYVRRGGEPDDMIDLCEYKEAT